MYTILQHKKCKRRKKKRERGHAGKYIFILKKKRGGIISQTLNLATKVERIQLILQPHVLHELVREAL
eukprot:m.16015 g.16015  ORF g.16015 m.16015 type:complete len:68 (+) comp4557_c0_seq1:1464-1667(+)